MENNESSIKFVSSMGLFAFLLVIKWYLFHLINIDMSILPNNIRTILNIVYVGMSLIITLIFYLKIKQQTDVKKYVKTFFTGICAISTYFILTELVSLPFVLAGINVTNMPIILKSIYLLSYEIVMLVIIYLILKDKINTAIEDIKKHHKEYFSKYIKYWILSLIIMSGSNILISFINGGQIAGNEEAVRNIFGQTPIYMFISAVFIASLTEELIFRQAIRNIFSNNKLFIVVSGLIFGGLHVFNSATNWMDLLYLIPYCTPGFIFAYILSKTDNVLVPAGLHFLHNGLMMSLQVLLLLLGQM